MCRKYKYPRRNNKNRCNYRISKKSKEIRGYISLMFCSLKLFVSFILGLPLTHVRIKVPLLNGICPRGYVAWGGGGGERGTHYNGLYGEIPSLRVIIFRLQVCESKYVKG